MPAVSSLSGMLKAQAVVSLKFSDSRLTLVLAQVSRIHARYLL